MLIKRKTRAWKACAYQMLLSFKTSVTYKFFNFTPTNCVRCEAVFVGHKLIFFAGLSPISGANIQVCPVYLVFVANSHLAILGCVQVQVLHIVYRFALAEGILRRPTVATGRFDFHCTDSMQRKE